MTRTVKSPREKAEEALGVSDRKIARATTKRDALTAQVKTLDAEIMAEEKQRAYLAQNPALKDDKPEPITSVSTINPADKSQVLMNDPTS